MLTKSSIAGHLYWAPAPGVLLLPGTPGRSRTRRYLASLSDGRWAGGGQSILPMLPSLSVMLAGSMPCGGHRAERERPGATGRLADQLQAALASRSVIDQALGMVMSRAGCCPEEVFERLKALSQREHRKLSEVVRHLPPEGYVMMWRRWCR
jgi:ANTAR domain-containing protein